MSAELIATIFFSVVALAFTVWQFSRGEQKKKTLPPKVEITYFALSALVAAHRRSAAATSGLTKNQLYEEVIADCNDYSEGGNFALKAKNKDLESYTQDSISKLANPPSQLGPLIEHHDDICTVTQAGIEIFDDLPDDRSERAGELDELLEGSRKRSAANKLSGRASETADATVSARASRRRATPQQWRHAVFMAVPEAGSYQLEELEELIGEKMGLDPLRQKAYDKKAYESVAGAIRWNLNKGNLSRDDDGNITLQASQDSRTADDFK